MKVGLFVSGTIRRRDQENVEILYPPREHEKLAKAIDADLSMAPGDGGADFDKYYNSAEINELRGVNPFDLKIDKDPIGRIPYLFWQCVGHMNMIQNVYKNYDVILRARWDNVYSDESIDLIKECIKTTYNNDHVFGFCSRKYSPIARDYLLNDHLIIHPAKKYDYDWCVRFIDHLKNIWSVYDNVRTASNVVCKGEYVWWWLICGQYNLPRKNFIL